MKPLTVIAICTSAAFTGHAETRIEQLPEVPTFSVNNGPVDVENSFTASNPYFKQRAGTFYETEYLGFSAAKLFKILDLENGKRVGALDILRGFIYDWLDFQVRDNGRITAEHHAEALNAMNAKFQRLLSPLQFELYEVWREDGTVNSLLFLIRYDTSSPQERDATRPQ
jgi:hypothetical protein